MLRRSVSSWVSPGPRVPMPPPSCDMALPRPVRRGSMYSSCASSTCNWPSRVRAWRAKMSRMSCVRSRTRQGKRGLKVAQLRGRKVVVEEDQVGFGGCGDAGNLFHFAGADQRGGIGPGAALHEFGGDFAAGARDQLAKLGERFFGIEAGPSADVAPEDVCAPMSRQRRACDARGVPRSRSSSADGAPRASHEVHADAEPQVRSRDGRVQRPVSVVEATSAVDAGLWHRRQTAN